jgi:hypothetical protein
MCLLSHSRLRKLVTVLAFAWTLSLPAPAAIVLSENFDALTPALAVTSAGGFSTINGTNVDVVGGGLFGSLCATPESGNCVDLDGSGGLSQGQFQSTMQFAAGTYLLSFDLIGSHRSLTASATVTFGNYNQTFTLASADVTGGIVVNQSVTLSSPGFLLFASNTPGNIGLLLDNVVVSTGTSAVPEPSSFIYLLLALLLGGAITGVRLRRGPVR